MMPIGKVIELWNAQADEHSKWEFLSTEEKIEWALKCTDIVTRKDVLLRATYDILVKCEEGPYVQSVLGQTAVWDDATCDGYCLMEEIKEELGLE